MGQLPLLRIVGLVYYSGSSQIHKGQITVSRVLKISTLNLGPKHWDLVHKTETNGAPKDNYLFSVSIEVPRMWNHHPRYSVTYLKFSKFTVRFYTSQNLEHRMFGTDTLGTQRISTGPTLYTGSARTEEHSRSTNKYLSVNTSKRERLIIRLTLWPRP